MKKFLPCLGLFLPLVTLGEYSSVHASNSVSFKEAIYSDIFSSTSKESCLGKEKIDIDIDRERLYDSTFPIADPCYVTQMFNTKLSTIFHKIEDIDKKNKENEYSEAQMKRLQAEIEKDQEISARQEEIYDEYKELNLSIDEVVKFLKGVIEEAKKSGSYSENDDYFKLIKNHIQCLDIPKDGFKVLNTLRQSYIKKTLAASFSDNSKIELEKLKGEYRNLLNLKLKTIYYLPKNFKDNLLIDSSQLLNLLKKMGIKDEVTQKINRNNLLRFFGHYLELPNPKMENTDNFIESYVVHVKDLIKRYNKRLTENMFDFIYLSSVSDLIQGKNLFELEEKELIKRIIPSAIEPTSCSQGKEYLKKLFQEKNYDSDYEKLTILFDKAMPEHSFSLLQALCVGFHKYQGVSFLNNDELQLTARVGKKIKKNGHDTIVDEEFFICRNRIIRNKFNIDVLKTIEENFEKALQKDESEEDPIL